MYRPRCSLIRFALRAWYSQSCRLIPLRQHEPRNPREHITRLCENEPMSFDGCRTSRALKCAADARPCSLALGLCSFALHPEALLRSRAMSGRKRARGQTTTDPTGFRLLRHAVRIRVALVDLHRLSRCRLPLEWGNSGLVRFITRPTSMAH